MVLSDMLPYIEDFPLSLRVDYSELGLGDVADIIQGIDARVMEAALFTAVELHPYQSAKVFNYAGDIPNHLFQSDRIDPDIKASVDLIVKSTTVGDRVAYDRIDYALQRAPSIAIATFIEYYNRELYERFLQNSRLSDSRLPRVQLKTIESGSIDISVDISHLLFFYLPRLFIALPEVVRGVFLQWVAVCVYGRYEHLLRILDGGSGNASLASTGVGQQSYAAKLAAAEDTFKRVSSRRKFKWLKVTAGDVVIEGDFDIEALG